MTAEKIAEELRALGRTSWGKNAHSYFSHSGGKVSLRSASEFYDRAIKLAGQAAAERDALKARVAEMEAALQPFARVGDKHHSGLHDDEFAFPIIRVGHCRRARALLPAAPLPTKGDTNE